MTNREFEIFAERSRGQLLATTRRYVRSDHVAEDVVQDALLKLFVMRDRLDNYRSVDALAIVVVKHMSLNVLRGSSRHPSVELNERTIKEPTSDDNAFSELIEIIDTLPAKQQLILRLKHIEGMEVEDIASATQISSDAIYQNLSRARRAILQKFKTKSDE